MKKIIAPAFTGIFCLMAAMGAAAQSGPAFGPAPGSENAPAGPELPQGVFPPGSISQSTSLAITPFTGIACSAGGITLSSSYLRRFFLNVDHGVSGPYSVNSVDIGIEVDDPGSAGACEGNPITVNVYSIPINDPFIYANMTLVETAAITLEGGTAGGTIVNVPLPDAGTVNPGFEDLVVEWVSCDHSGTDGVGRLFPGANADPEIQPSYVVAAGCGIVEPTTLDSIGFTDSNNVLTVQGTEGEPQSLATFRVDKNFTDDNDAEVNVELKCNNGQPLVQDFDISEGSGVAFVLTNYSDGEPNCVVTETEVPGYDVEYFNGVTTSDTGCEYEGIVFSDRRICVITNTPTPVTVTVNKDWVYHNTGNVINEAFSIAMECNAVITGGYSVGEGMYRIDRDGDGDSSFDFEVHPTVGGNSCSVTETSIYDSGIVVDAADCEVLDIDISQGASCTITNTVFFEGVPTLNQYGMAILALLMLSVGLVGFRRFV